mmetsp:Transcript_52638/g.124576  ORF Transcript_52638/g.124576 Transcript_52638/m.124576 type:complete len:244 (+) Transcript_52638:60-791(+)
MHRDGSDECISPFVPPSGWVGWLEDPIFCRTRSAAALEARARKSKSKLPKLRKIVNAIKFVNELSHKGGTSNGNGVRNAGVHKATNKATSSSIDSPSRPLQASKHKKETQEPNAATFPKEKEGRKEPNAAAGIPLTWGGVERLEEHWIGVAGVKYLARCETATDWVLEGALERRKDGMTALSAYRQENGALLVKELTALKTRLEDQQNFRAAAKGGVSAKLKRWSSNAVSSVLSTAMTRLNSK